MGQSAALYCRVSTADQSCARQERDLRTFAKKAGYKVAGFGRKSVHQWPMTPAPGILNRILFQLFVKDLLPVPRTTVDRHVGDGEVMDDLDGLQVMPHRATVQAKWPSCGHRKAGCYSLVMPRPTHWGFAC